MARETIYDLQNQRLRAGRVLGPFVVPADKLAGRTFAYLTITVDDPNADPPTDAKVGGEIDASTDGGSSWFTIATMWCGVSIQMEATVAVAGRAIRARAHADQDAIVSLRVEVA